MLLEIYIGVVLVGAAGVFGQHYLPKLKNTSLPKFKFPSLTVKKFDFNKAIPTPPMPMVPPAKNPMDAIRASTGATPIQRGGGGINPFVGGVGGTTYTVGGGGGSSSQLARMGGGGAGAVGVASYLNTNNDINYSPFGLEFIERINRKYPYAQVVLMQPNTDFNTKSMTLDFCWFSSRGSKNIGRLTLRYPDFNHIDLHDANMDAMTYDAGAMIYDIEHSEALAATKIAEAKIQLTKPQVKAYPDYMNTIMNKKLEELAAKKQS